MKKEEILLGDWQRILLGNAPLEFMLEVLIRTLIIYFILLIAIRLLGKRMSSNITIFEMAVMLMLGAVVSVPMQTPERGLIQGVIVLACVVALYKGFSLLTYKSRKAELFTQGDVSLLVKNGIIDVQELRRAAVSHEQLFAKIRSMEIRQLGQVKRVYLEACGIMSIYENPEPKPGLNILPSSDETLNKTIVKDPQYLACKNCGNVQETKHSSAKACNNCAVHDWDYAVTVAKEQTQVSEEIYS
jgi:uncharacterized membrane protein YcaP (DUF421 family)